MFSMITYIVLFKDGFFSVFLSGCLADTELSFLPERYSRCFRVDDMIQKEPFTAQYASYIDKCDQSDRRKNELEPFFTSCLYRGAKEIKLGACYFNFDILLIPRIRKERRGDVCDE